MNRYLSRCVEASADVLDKRCYGRGQLVLCETLHRHHAFQADRCIRQFDVQYVYTIVVPT